MSAAANHLDQIRIELGDSWLPQLYRDRVLKIRTRAYEFPPLPANCSVEINHTLLGIELRAGRRRMLCPDLATARYLSVFVRLRCRAVAIPYDITKISLLADELESSWQRMLLIADRGMAGERDALRARVRRQIIAKVRDEIESAGAGPRIPQFKHSTKQRTEPQKSTKGTKEIPRPKSA